MDWTRVAAGKRVPDPQEGRAFAMPWEWRSGEKTLEMCRHECLQHPECVGIEFCGPDEGGKHACDSNECILLSSTLDSNKAAGWAIYQVRRQHIRTCEQRCADCPCLHAQHVPAGSMGGGH